MWTYLVTDLRTKREIGRLPFTNVRFDQALDGSGSFTADTDSSHTAWSDNLADDLMRRVIWPVRAGQPVGAFLLAALPPADMATAVKPVRAVSLAAVLKRRLIQHTLAFNQIDQNEIIRDLIRYALGRGSLVAQVNAALPLSWAAVPWIWLDTNKSGVLRDRLETPGNTDDGYTANGRKVVGDCLDKLRDLEGGAEFRWLYGLDTAGMPAMRLDTGGPPNDHKVGRAPGAAGQLVFEYPSRTVAKCDLGADGEAMVTRAHVVGQDREGVRPIGVATDQSLLDQGYPLLESVWSESSVQEQQTLDAKAAARRSGRSEAVSLVLNGDLPPVFTTYALGDHCALRVRRHDGVRLPDRVIRFTGWSVEVPDSGVGEKVTPAVEVVS